MVFVVKWKHPESCSKGYSPRFDTIRAAEYWLQDFNSDGHVESELFAISERACCEKETRNFNGGCDNCGDPCF